MVLEWLFGRSRARDQGRRGVRKAKSRSPSPRSETELIQAPRLSLPVHPPPLVPGHVVSSSRDPRWAAPAGPPAIVIPPLSSIERSDVEATRVVGTLDSPSHAVIAVLVGVAGVLEGEIYRVRDGENRIGRLQGLEISLPQKDDQISREHAILIHREGAFGIKLLKASNPMRVNGDVVTDGAALSDGDEISIGRSTFRLRVV